MLVIAENIMKRPVFPEYSYVIVVPDESADWLTE